MATGPRRSSDVDSIQMSLCFRNRIDPKPYGGTLAYLPIRPGGLGLAKRVAYGLFCDARRRLLPPLLAVCLPFTKTLRISFVSALDADGFKYCSFSIQVIDYFKNQFIRVL